MQVLTVCEGNLPNSHDGKLVFSTIFCPLMQPRPGKHIVNETKAYIFLITLQFDLFLIVIIVGGIPSLFLSLPYLSLCVCVCVGVFIK